MKILRLLVATTIISCLSAAANATPMLDFLIDGDTYTQPFSITNSSDAGEKVTRFQLDLTGIGICYDLASSGPNACNSSIGVNFSAVGGTGSTTGLVSGTVSPDLKLLDVVFNDFDAGETFNWDIDVDFDPGSPTVFGNQMIGALATIDFSDGQRLTGNLFAVAGNADASQFSVTGVTLTPSVPEPGMLTLLGLGLGLLGFRRRSI